MIKKEKDENDSATLAFLIAKKRQKTIANLQDDDDEMIDLDRRQRTPRKIYTFAVLCAHTNFSRFCMFISAECKHIHVEKCLAGKENNEFSSLYIG
jgi:hypothetical protein